MGSKAPITRQQISDNFALAKFLSIVLVSTGHYFSGSLLWVPVTVGLFIFAFSSGYFTSLKHNPEMPLSRFWLAKIRRLGPPMIVINLFLIALFHFQGRDNIWHPHSLLGMTGLTGLLNWFGIPNQSPFGAGLWFMTVLLLFYLLYPGFVKLFITQARCIAFLILSAVICTLGHFYASPPYMLWPTVFGFCSGAVAGRIDWKPKKLLVIASLASIFIFLFLANAIGIKQWNVLLIIMISIASVALLLSTPIGISPRNISILTSSILEIYLIHGYLFIHPSEWPRWLGYVSSMLLIISASVLLNLVAQRISISIKL